MLETTKSITINDEVFNFKLNGDKFYTTSLEIAKRFSKRHSDIIRTIESDKELLEDFIIQRKIALYSYIASNGKENKMYLLDRDSFSYFVMGFTGKEARKWKLAYIKAFNEMERRLREPKRQLATNYIIEEMEVLKSVTEALKVVEKAFNINGIETVKKIDSILKDEGLNIARKALPSYTANKYVGTIGEVSERVSHAYSYFYKDNANYPEIKLSAIKFNKLALTSDYYDLKTRNSSSGKIKKFYVLKDKYLKYGKNIVSKQNSNQTQIHLYDDSIKEFYQLVTTI